MLSKNEVELLLSSWDYCYYYHLDFFHLSLGLLVKLKWMNEHCFDRKRGVISICRRVNLQPRQYDPKLVSRFPFSTTTATASTTTATATTSTMTTDRVEMIGNRQIFKIAGCCCWLLSYAASWYFVTLSSLAHKQKCTHTHKLYFIYLHSFSLIYFPLIKASLSPLSLSLYLSIYLSIYLPLSLSLYHTHIHTRTIFYFSTPRTFLSF